MVGLVALDQGRIMQSVENRRKKRHRFWLRLRHAVILISNDRTSASKKINGMALIRTLTVSTTAFDRMKEKFCGFRQTEWEERESLGLAVYGMREYMIILLLLMKIFCNKHLKNTKLYSI